MSRMGSSLRLFRVWGIDVRVHWSFVLILVYGAFIYAGHSNPVVGALYGIVVILLLFVCVLLHEFGHALTAKYFNVNVPNITLLPIGGVAQLERMPRQPFQEFLIAIAGPAVNFVLTLLLLPVALLVVGLGVESANISSLFTYAQTRMMTPSLDGLLVYLAITNLALGLFNLLPAFPMDGGRVLRALLAMAMPYVRATRIAVMVGRMMAILLAFLGLGGNIMLLLIAFFVYVGGRGELEAVESRYVLKDIRVRQALNADAHQIFTSETIDKAVDLIMTTYQADFPVFDLGSNFVGVLTRNRLVDVLRTHGREGRVVDIMIPAQEVPVVGADVTLADVWDRMLEARSRVVAVKENGRFLGLLTLDDISELIQVVGAAKELEDRRAAQRPTKAAL
ncbi:MAG: site-2 protease family protein [Caldilineaceae bacterium]|nr:site-2 protease family protein [Caldilineaceae bacterium]